ncbi:MAG: hypothetical protein EOO69_13570 [Moraxellaceae bacterium]|nr:MAG: hypothetical protein EOO69_13570 [Moraxellaceae bacterium]
MAVGFGLFVFFISSEAVDLFKGEISGAEFAKNVVIALVVVIAVCGAAYLFIKDEMIDKIYGKKK